MQRDPAQKVKWCRNVVWLLLIVALTASTAWARSRSPPDRHAPELTD